MSNRIQFTTEDLSDLNRSLNQKYYQIMDESNVLIDKYNLLIRKLRNFKTPKSFDSEYLLRPEKRFKRPIDELNSIIHDIRELDAKIVIWNEKASNFLSNPKLYLPSHLNENQKQTSFNHLNDLLKWRINTIVNSIKTLMDAGNNEVSKIEQRLSLAISFKFSFIFTFFGILTAVLIAILD